MRVDLKLFDSQLGAKEVHSVLTEGGGSMGTYNLVNDYTLTLQNGRNKAADKISTKNHWREQVTANPGRIGLTSGIK